MSDNIRADWGEVGHWNTVTLAIAEDGRVDRVGIVTDPGTRLVARRNGIIVIKLPGGKHWSGRGEQRYHGAEYEVYGEVEVYEGTQGVRVKCVRLLDFPVRDGK